MEAQREVGVRGVRGSSEFAPVRQKSVEERQLYS